MTILFYLPHQLNFTTPQNQLGRQEDLKKSLLPKIGSLLFFTLQKISLSEHFYFISFSSMVSPVSR